MTTRIDLDKHFRQESAARTIAERLLTGKPQTRQELVEDLGVSVTTVNRVVELLMEAGAKIVRDIADDGRQARFRVVAVEEPKSKRRFPTLDDEIEIVGAFRVGDATMVELAGDKAHFRGQLKSLSKMIPLGSKGTVSGVNRTGEGLATIRLETGEKALVIESVQVSE